MKSFILTSVLSLGLAAPAMAGDLSSAERAALAGLPATDVAALRAGASAAVPSVSLGESLELSRAAAASTDLDLLRASADDHDLSVVAIVVSVVVLAILIF